MNTITLDSKAVMNAFIEEGITKENEDLAVAFYDAARKIEMATERIATLSEQVRESLDEIGRGREPFHNLGETALAIERHVVEKKEAERVFNLLAKLNHLTVG